MTGTGEAVMFWILAPLSVVGALGLVFARKAVHAALGMALTMIILGIFYIAQDADFLGIIQIFVYTGAVIMLFLFVLMLIGIDSSDSLVETLTGQRWLAALLSLGLGVKLHLALRRLRDDNTDFDRLVHAIDGATDRARSVLDDLKRAAGAVGERLGGDLGQAQRVLDDLRFLCERGERVADGLAGQIESSRGPPPVRAHAAAARPRPTPPAGG